MLRQTSRLLLFALLSILVLTAAGCASPPEPTATPAPEVVPLNPVKMEGEPVRVAVLAIRSAVSANAQYGPILDYLSETLGRPFEFVPVSQEDQFVQVEKNNVDFTFNNPLAAVQLRRLYGIDFLATLSRTNGGPEFSSLIIVRNDSGIDTLDDLRGKTATCVAFETAAAGCNFQVYHLLQNGIDPYTDFSNFTETPSQDNIVLGVLNGTYDAGFIRTGQLERMVAEGKLLNLDEIRVLDQADDDFIYPHTTRLYPEWPFAALKDTDPELVAAVREALLAMPTDHPAMVNAGAVGFLPAVDYTPLDDLIVALKLRSWDADTPE